nr:DUF1206 domain-containing protein [Pseudoruegeria sp. HB172150]
MRAGYAGRGLTYLAIAGFSLWAISRGGDAKGTGSALQSLESSGGGYAVLALIALGLSAYFVWRLVDAYWDLEAYGTGAKGIIARAGMVVTGLIHAALAIAALSLIFGSGSGGNSAVITYVGKALSVPFGRWLIGIAGVCTIGAGIYYGYKGLAGKYREHLRGNSFTMNWNWVLKAGLLAQGVIVGLIGFFLIRAAILGQPEEAGGLDKVFDFLESQAFGKVIVVAICLGLLGFAVFCFVNVRYRIVPRVADDGIETLAARIAAAI